MRYAATMRRRNVWGRWQYDRAICDEVPREAKGLGKDHTQGRLSEGGVTRPRSSAARARLRESERLVSGGTVNLVCATCTSGPRAIWYYHLRTKISRMVDR